METIVKTEIIEDSELHEKVCYFCGNQLFLKSGQISISCGLCGETVKFEVDDDAVNVQDSETRENVRCPLCKTDVIIDPRKGPVSCKECHEVLHFSSSEIEHDPDSCEVCRKRIRHQRRIKKQLKKHKHKTKSEKNAQKSTDEDRHGCDVCSKVFVTASSLAIHQKVHENIVKLSESSIQHVCDVCSRVFLKACGLAVHRKVHDKISNPVESPIEYVCEVCDQKFSLERQLEMHKLVHVPKNKFQCRFCEYMFKSVRSRFVHEEANHMKKGKDYTCIFCGLTIISKRYFIEHVEQHRQYVTSKCLISGPNVSSSEQLENHDNGIEHTKPYSEMKCVRCGMVLADMDLLLQTHTCTSTKKDIDTYGNVKDFECGGCGVSFSELKDLEEHVCYPSIDASKNQPTKKKHRHSCNDSSDKIAIEEYVLKLLKTDRFLTPRIIYKLTQETFPDSSGRNIATTILKKYGFWYGGGFLRLSEEERLLRLLWAEHYSTWTEADWGKVLWTGEARFRRYATPDPNKTIIKVSARQRLWRHQDELESEKVVQSLTTGENVLHVWGCMSRRGFGKLCRLECGLDSDSYLDILQNCMLPSAWAMIGPDFILQHDVKARYVKDRSVRKWLSNPLPATKFDVLQLPPQSTDLNPLENLWNRLCSELDGFEVDDMDALWEKMEKAAKAIPERICINLINTMRRRCSTVVEANGGSITCV